MEYRQHQITRILVLHITCNRVHHGLRLQAIYIYIYIYIYILSEESQQYSATRRGTPPKRIATLLQPQTASLSFSLQLLANNHNGANDGISNSFKRRYTIIMKFHSMGNNYGQTYSRRAEIPAASHSKARLSHA